LRPEFYKRLAKGIGKVFIIRKNYKLKEKLKEIKEKIIFVFLFRCRVNGMGKSCIIKFIIVLMHDNSKIKILIYISN